MDNEKNNTYNSNPNNSVTVNDVNSDLIDPQSIFTDDPNNQVYDDYSQTDYEQTNLNKSINNHTGVIDNYNQSSNAFVDDSQTVSSYEEQLNNSQDISFYTQQSNNSNLNTYQDNNYGDEYNTGYDNGYNNAYDNNANYNDPNYNYGNGYDNAGYDNGYNNAYDNNVNYNYGNGYDNTGYDNGYNNAYDNNSYDNNVNYNDPNYNYGNGYDNTGYDNGYNNAYDNNSYDNNVNYNDPNYNYSNGYDNTGYDNGYNNAYDNNVNYDNNTIQPSPQVVSDGTKHPKTIGPEAFDKKMKKNVRPFNLMLVAIYVLIIGVIGYLAYSLWVDRNVFDFSKEKMNLVVGSSYDEKVYLKGKLDSVENYKWESDNESIATVDSKGRIVAKKEGTAKITVTNKKTKKSNFITVKVIDVKIKQFIIKPSEKVVYIGSTYTVIPYINGQSSLTIDLEWKSSDTEVATVDEEGVVTPHKSGHTNVTVTIPNTDYKATISIIVSKKS